MRSRSLPIQNYMEKYEEHISPSQHSPVVSPLHNPETRTSITNVVIPSNLLSGSHPGPYVLGPKQNERPSDIESGPSFNAQNIAYHQKEAIKRTIVRPTSICVGGAERSRAIGYDSRANDFVIAGPRAALRKTSLGTRRQSEFINRLADLDEPSPTISPRGPRSGNRPRQTDYFGRYEFAAGSQRSRPSITQASPLEGPTGTISRISVERTGVEGPRPSISENLRKGSVIRRAGSIVADAIGNTQDAIRRTSLYDIYERAKVRGVELQRKKWAMITFEYTFYLLLIAFIYFVLVGVPLWKGSVYWLWWVFGNKFTVPGTWAVTVGVAALYAYTPLAVFFEKDPPMLEKPQGASQTAGVHNTALMIPCYKSENIIGPTLEAATKIFPASHIFVIANGNSPTPLDNTEEVCKKYGVNHVWSPIGSKIVAQFVGCYAAKGYKNVLLIDDDCALPPNFPIVSDRMTDEVKCIGYTIKSVGPGSSRGTLCQQAQDLEYKISGIQRALAGKVGSATFPHGAISLWDSDFLIQTFREHPGFSVSEDWFFGHVARKLGSRIQMCTSVLIETETPSSVFFSSGGARGGFGEMTIFKQRFMRWNFFFVNGIWYNMAYIFGSWKLGWWEFGAKLFVFQEVYETLLYLLTPFVLPISFAVRPSFSGYLFAGTFVLYFLNIVIFNEVHLRLKHERVPSKCVYLYYMPYKVVLTAINVGSCYWSLYKYATYFAKRHPRIIEDEKAVDVVLRMEEASSGNAEAGGRRMTVTAIGSQLHGYVMNDTNPSNVEGELETTITTLGPRLDNETHTLPPVMEGQPLEAVSNVIRPSVITVGGKRFSFESDQNRPQQGSGSANLEPGGSPLHKNRPPIEREMESPEELHHVVSAQSLPETLARGFSNRSSRRSGSATPSSRRSRSFERSNRRNDVDFSSVDFSELMDRLTAINERLNR